MKYLYLNILVILFTNCGHQTASVQNENISYTTVNYEDSSEIKRETDSILIINDIPQLDRFALVNFAKTLQGIPYKYGSANPENGFDCSGFITYTFNHFNFPVPRSSVDFTNYGNPISFRDALPGDLILFTGTDSTKRVVGHMGILTQTTDSIKFIHSTSGKAYSVTITPLNKYYAGRFVKIIRVLE